MGKKRAGLAADYAAWLDRVRGRMRAVRESLGLTYRAAEARTGVPFASIARIESGRIKEPTVDILWRLAKGYGVPVGELLCDAAAPKKSK